MEDTDECYYLGEYTARQGYAHSPTNDLIINLKKHPRHRGSSHWHYKQRAVTRAGIALRQAFNPAFLRTATLIPVPPSKAHDHEFYDDRMLQTLRVVGRNEAVDIRELVHQRESTDPVHECEVRPTPYEIAANYYIDETFAEPVPRVIVVADDVLTKGSHFKAMQMVLSARFPCVPIKGVFVARRVPQPNELEILRSLLDL